MEFDYSWADRQAPSLEDFAVLARQAFDSLPMNFRAMAGDVLFEISEFPENEVLDAFEAETDFDIMGLFQGVGIAHGPAVAGTGELPNRIWLYRRPIIDYWAGHEETLGAVISHVLIHEIGHHFGLSDDDMDDIEAAA